ncbi:ATP-binding protein [Deinococcus sp. Arct2-2]|uniref:ATP-binding protein n=1 Tax=Deinococcus sp. Arct2-2 TaxID=2568653 RepID=UPI0010A38435|nr:ATP-binding protein [Deinococcus sp. Arct2-2]THF70152.1 ATP-binding protein [Deinococcus sp. Arct2-2]
MTTAPKSAAKAAPTKAPLTLSAADLKTLRGHLRAFEFADVMNLLGWNRPKGQNVAPVQAAGQTFPLKPIAELGGVQVLEVACGDVLPDAPARLALSDSLLTTYREHLLIFVNAGRDQSQWVWVKRDLKAGDKKAKPQPRTHTYVKGQPDDLFVSKLAGLFVDMVELNVDGDLKVTEVAARLATALDSQVVVKRFYDQFKRDRIAFTEQIQGIPDERDRAWYASVVLNRLMFVYFLQRKGFLNVVGKKAGDLSYLQHKLKESRSRGEGRYYPEFLKALFFEAFAKPDADRSTESVTLTGAIPYLNGGLFLPHPIETKHTTKKSDTLLCHEIADQIFIPDEAFDLMLGLFAGYEWNLSEEDKHAGGLDPDVLGHIFEKYINQKGFGAYYTRPEITEYLCKQTVDRLVLDRINARKKPGERPETSLADALMRADVGLTRWLLTADDGLKSLSLLDPACGSGAFLVAALKTLLDVYSTLMGRLHVFNDPTLNDWSNKLHSGHRSANYNLKKKIITENLYGVDLMEEAAEIAKLRLFLSLVSSANELIDLEPLPNIDFNILTGNSLVGLLHVDDKDYDRLNPQQSMFEPRYPDIIQQRTIDLNSYRHAADLKLGDLRKLRDDIEANRKTAQTTLNRLLLADFHRLGIKFEQATWDAAKGKEGKPTKRTLTLADIEALRPFHWGFEFSEVMGRGGFDAIIANPPWDVVKPNAKEFFETHSALVSKNKMGIKDFEKEQDKLLADPAIRAEWLAYQSSYPHVSAYYRAAPQFAHQSSTVNGKKTGSDLNLYKLFLEQSFRLLKAGGECGIVIPSGIYTDLGAKGLREMLFDETDVTGLFCFENRRVIFENVDSRFKFVVLSFRKGGHTAKFPAAFMRHEVKDLLDFPGAVGMDLTVDMVRRLSPDSLSVMEFKSELDAHIAEKMLQFPLLGEQLDGVWNLKLTREFDMTNDSHLFKTSSGPGRLPLYEGKIIHQFRHDWGQPKYWLDEAEASKVLRAERVKAVEREAKKQNVAANLDVSSLKLDYQSYRIAFRDITAPTNERTFISTVLQSGTFCPHTMSLESVFEDRVNAGKTELNIESMTNASRLYVVALFNSFMLDSLIRQRVTSHVSFFFVYGLPVPRLTPTHPEFQPIVQAAARLICTAPEFDELAQAAGLRGGVDGVTDEAGRAALRADLDGRVAHLYGLSESEFTHILGTFPLVSAEVKAAALAAFVRLVPPKGDPELARLVRQPESELLEFKSSLRSPTNGDPATPELRGKLEAVVVKEVAAFLNGKGGTLLIGVDDAGKALGLAADYASSDKIGGPDGFERHLRGLLGQALGQDVAAALSISVGPLDGQDVCRVQVPAGAQEAFVVVADKSGAKRHVFYHRSGNKAEELPSGPELARYQKTRWA